MGGWICARMPNLNFLDHAKRSISKTVQMTGTFLWSNLQCCGCLYNSVVGTTFNAPTILMTTQ
jgi:hypothetical protein